MTAKRSSNPWNLYLRDNYENVKSGMHDISLFSNIPSDFFIIKTSHNEMIKEVLNHYKNCLIDNEIDESMTFSRFNTSFSVRNTSS